MIREQQNRIARTTHSSGVVRVDCKMDGPSYYFCKVYGKHLCVQGVFRINRGIVEHSRSSLRYCDVRKQLPL